MLSKHGETEYFLSLPHIDGSKPKEHYGDCLVIYKWSHSSRLPEIGWNNYCQVLCSRNRQDAPKTTARTISISQSKKPYLFCFTTTPNLTFQWSLDRSSKSCATKLLIIHYVYLIFRQRSIIFSSGSTTSCVRNALQNKKRLQRIRRFQKSRTSKLAGKNKKDVSGVGYSIVA